MSPEQADPDNFDIDTRTDIYSLGVILYELLTGRTPLEEANIEDKGLLKTIEMVCEYEPAKPSRTLANLEHENLTHVTRRRSSDPNRLKRILSGDLDWIVMKALDKDPSRRYATANGFAADVGHYLSNEPVNARPPSFNYLLGKFVRKHRLSVAAALLVGITLVAISISAIVASVALNRELKSRQLATEADQAARETVDEFTTMVANETLLEQPGMIKLRDKLLQKSLDYYESRWQEGDPTLADLPLALSHYNVGRIKINLDPQESEDSFLQASLLLKQLHENDPGNDETSLLYVMTLLELAKFETRKVLDETEAVERALDLTQLASKISKSMRKDDPHNADLMLIDAKAEMAIAMAYGASAFPDRAESIKHHLTVAKKILDEALAKKSDQEILLEKVTVDRYLAKTKPYQTSVQMLQQAVNDLSTDIDALSIKLASVELHAEIGRLHWSNRAYPLAVVEYSNAIDLLQPWASVNPRNKGLQLWLGELYDFKAYNMHQAWKRTEQTSTSDLDEAARLYELARVSYEEFGDTSNQNHVRMLCNIYNGHGLIERDRTNYELSLEWFQKSLDLLDDLPNMGRRPAGLLEMTLDNIASVYDAQQEFADALPLIDQAVDIALKDRANFEPLARSLDSRSTTNLGVYLQKQDPRYLDAAIKDVQLSMDEASKVKSETGIYFYISSASKKINFLLMRDGVQASMKEADKLVDWGENKLTEPSAVNQHFKSTIHLSIAKFYGLALIETDDLSPEQIDAWKQEAIYHLQQYRDLGGLTHPNNVRLLRENLSVPEDLSDTELTIQRYANGKYTLMEIDDIEKVLQLGNSLQPWGG